MITQVHVGNDKGGVAAGVDLEDSVFASEGFMACLDVMVRPGGLGGNIAKHYHDYAKIVTIG